MIKTIKLKKRPIRRLFDLHKGSLNDVLSQVINNSNFNNEELESISKNAVKTINDKYSISKILNEEKNMLNNLVNDGKY